MPLFLAQAFLPSFLVPGLAIAGAAAISIPIAIHILSRRPRRPEPWAAMRFLLAAYQKHRLRTRLEQWLLLAARCLLILLIGLALAGPVGAAIGSLAGLGADGRAVVIVLDNSLTSGAADGVGGRRFDRLKGAADRLLDSLTPADRVALITASRPARPVVSPPALGPTAVRPQIEMTQPTHAAADLPEALRLALEALEQLDDPTRPAYVAVLSDFSAGAVPAGTPLPRELARLGERATLLMLAPTPTARNVQVASLQPDRRVIVANRADATPTVAWSLTLRRYTADPSAEERSTVRLELPNAAPIRRQVTWQPGQSEVQLRIDTPLNRDGLIVAEAALEPPTEGGDALTADNSRWSLVRARRQLTVALIGRTDPEEEGFTPRRWLAIALAPVADRLGWPIELRERDAAALGAAPEELSGADAAFVLRPDLLGETGWDTLARWTEAGGLAWFIPPPDPSPALWPQELADTFGLPWSVLPDPVQHDPPLRLATDNTGGEELDRLRVDLPDLIRPINVHRRLPIDPASLGSDTDVLLSGTDGQPLLIGAMTPQGRGRVLLSAVSIDADWTNLPTKPLFVPLIHETLRAAIDRLQPRSLRGGFEPGDRPRLSAAWADAARLTAPDGEEILLVEAGADDEPSPGEPEPDRDESEDAEEDGGGVRPIRPLQQPGVYRSNTDALAVNIRPEAGDTRAVEEAALRDWLQTAGPWEMIELENPAAPMTVQADRADLSWPLLWAVLALALAEMTLARYASHASTRNRSADATDARTAA